MKYDVHIYAIVRVKVQSIEAESQTEAIEKARVNTDMEQAIQEGEFTDEVTGYLVDEAGDAEFKNTRVYLADGVTLDPNFGLK